MQQFSNGFEEPETEQPKTPENDGDEDNKPAFNTEGAPKGHTPSRGDIDLYAPWGNVALFYKSGSHSSELIHLGRIDGNGIEAFDVTGNVVVKIERQ